MANDPRNLEVFQAQRMESVHANPRSGTTTTFFRVLERIAGIEGGTGTSDFVISDVASKVWLKFYVQSTYAGSAYPGGGIVDAYLSLTGVRTWGGTVGKFEMRVDTPKTEGNARNMKAIQGILTMGDGADHPLGSAYAGEFEIGYQNQTDALLIDQCTHRCINLKATFGTNVTVNTALTAWAYIGLEESGASAAAHPGYFLDTLGVRTDANAAVPIHSAVGDNSPIYYLTVRNPAGALNYIAMYDQHQG